MTPAQTNKMGETETVKGRKQFGDQWRDGLSGSTRFARKGSCIAVVEVDFFRSAKSSIVVVH